MDKTYLEVWQDLLQSLAAENLIVNLSREKFYEVVKIDAESILVTTDSYRHLVDPDWIKAAWDILASQGQLTPTDLPDSSASRTDLILALLARLPYIKSSSAPPQLYLA